MAKRKVQFLEDDEIIPTEVGCDEPESFPDPDERLNEELQLFKDGRLRGEERHPSSSLLREKLNTPVTAFNLDEELDHGYVDKEGSFVDAALLKRKTKGRGGRLRGQEGDASSDEDDPWLQKQREKAVGKAIYGKELDSDEGEPDAWVDSLPSSGGDFPQDDQHQRKRHKVGEESMTSEGDLDRWRRSLATLLLPGETVASGLRRLGKTRGKDESVARDFDSVTDLACRLLEAGYHSIYQDLKEEIWKEEELGTEKVLWELRWGNENHIFGPFESSAIRGWQEAGYFGSGDRVGFLRRVGEKEFSPASTISLPPG